ncbi:hypothetical protein E4U43_004920 [Claviceps pusilla]|uniref:Uncharacterized protein n=1 Tax=Claviceps pusilla TaxID=123648 RepID=A0A9P7N3G8_9HYPO|nr:hypothetical protein E4U43_004920 [Claviceps pusilla]
MAREEATGHLPSQPAIQMLRSGSGGWWTRARPSPPTLGVAAADGSRWQQRGAGCAGRARSAGECTPNGKRGLAANRGFWFVKTAV